MSISQDSAATIVCREVFDETSHPSNEEVLDYAKRLGIDPDAEPQLLDLAREGLMAALPKGWSPCFHESSSAWYYYQASSGTTTWEHPLDSVYKELVEQARTGNRQMSVEEDSKTTAKDLESHEEASLPKEIVHQPKDTTVSKLVTKIPVKLAPLRKLERIDGARRRDEQVVERSHSKQREEGESSRLENSMSLASDRAARDYTNLRFQDPKFYECPMLLDATSPVTNQNASTSGASINATTSTVVATSPVKKELDLREVLKRSESLSPRHEKDWEQLSSKFSSEENIIDIDKLSASTLARSERPEKFDKEKHPSQLGQQKELTLSGGGTMFLKSNRSRDTTPSQDGAGKLEEFRTLTISDEAGNIVGDRLKSILREKQSEDDDRHVDEERKSVRFDLEKEIDIKFTYSVSEDGWDSDSEDENPRISMTTAGKVAASLLALQRTTARGFENLVDDDNVEEEEEEEEEDEEDEEEENDKDVLEEKELDDARRSSSSERIVEPAARVSKIVGSRFHVQNVSENEHLLQMVAKEKVSLSATIYTSTGRFDRVKNIDLVSKSETDCSVARSSDSDEVRRKKTLVVRARNSGLRFKDQRQEDSETSDVSRTNPEVDLTNLERFGKPKLSSSASFDEAKADLTREHDQELEKLKKDFAAKLERTKQELEDNFVQQKAALQENTNERLEELKREMAEKEEQEIQKLIAEMDETRLENLKKVRAELEVCYEKERQEILANLKTELDERKKELLELRNQEIGKLENEHERDLGEEKLAKMNELELTKQHTEKIEALKKELEKEFDELRTELRMQQREKITKITEDHEKCLAEILRDFRIDEGLARKMYKQRLEEIRADFSRDTEKEARKQSERALQQDTIDFEKMRCEKRLLQDKYTALKEKYVKLKTDVRLAVVKRTKRKEGYTTASETEKSASTRTRTERTESSEQNTPLRSTRSGSITGHAKQPEHDQSGNEQSQGQNNEEDDDATNSKSVAGFPTSTADSVSAGAKNPTKFESDDTTTTASEMNANMMKQRKSFTKKVATSTRQLASANGGNNNNNNLDNSVENIRKQLEKIEVIGDQLPGDETAYTLRYPFEHKALANASSELEFFRHRIHVERDSVRRAKEALRQQRSVLQGRQRAWKQRSARATLEQLVQEERELSDMEVSLHRTWSLLGEKVIHLRHLEQSLERVANAKKNESEAISTKNDELTLSDMSSASSGFSSTDLGTDTFIDKPDHYQESTEIIASLENLNSEIREIWGVLNKRQDSNIPPPSTLMYSYLRWLRFHQFNTQPNSAQGSFGTPNIQSNILSQLTASQPPTAATQNIIAQYGPNSGFTTSVGTVDRNPSNLMERSRNLRDWLRQARAETTDLVSPGQATL